MAPMANGPDIHPPAPEPVRLRAGRKVGRTIYWQLGQAPDDADLLVGVMDTPELAAMVVEAVNSRAGSVPPEPGALHATTDAQVWARAWCAIARRLHAEGEDLIDEGWMIGWFANAIETGRSAGAQDRS